MVTQDLIRRSGDLKQQIVNYACSGRFDRDMRQALPEQTGIPFRPDSSLDIDALDHFILRHRLSNGRTVVEDFVSTHPELSEPERAMLLSWSQIVEGIFVVDSRVGDGLKLVNLVDDLTYVVYSNAGTQAFAPVAAGSFLIARLVPLDDGWLLSGIMQALPASEHAAAYQAAGHLALQQPSLVYRNPAKLEQAWKLQRENRENFIAFFGADLIVVPGPKLAERMRAFHRYQLYEQRDAEGTTAADRAKEAYGTEPPVPEYDLPEDLRSAETVGVISDEMDGMSFMPDFGMVLEAFERPERAALRRYRKLLLSLLRDPSTSPRLLRRLAAQDPDRASQVFQRVLKRPRFSWDRDGEALLRDYKADYFEHPVLPTVAVVSGAVARAQLAESTGKGL